MFFNKSILFYCCRCALLLLGLVSRNEYASNCGVYKIRGSIYETQCPKCQTNLKKSLRSSKSFLIILVLTILSEFMDTYLCSAM